MDQDANRLLMRFERLLRTVNHDVINPEIEALSIDSLKPMVHLVARCRAAYLKALFELANKYDNSDDYPTPEEMQQLEQLRKRFIDLADGSKSVEICIQRGYMDLK